MARLHVQIHRLEGTHMPSQHERLRARIGATPLLDEPTRNRLLEGLGQFAAGDRLCHGDFHPFNIIGGVEAPIIVDWLDACQGVPAADICRSYLLMSVVAPAFARRYVEACSNLSGIAIDEIYRWLPFMAAARLMENVPEEIGRLLAMAQDI
jgi:Ser/Thr protein kinase RdoA (MazF antagonist)